MGFYSLDIVKQSALLAIIYISVISLSISVFVGVLTKRFKVIVLVLSFLLVVEIIDLMILTELMNNLSPKYNFELSKMAVAMEKIPYYFHVVFSLICIAFAFISIKNEYEYTKNSISHFSIKEAIEKLPTGIAFMSKTEELSFSNTIMHDLSKELFKRDLKSAKDFWNDILALQNTQKCVIKGSEPSFMLSNGQVWKISKTLCVYKGEEYYQIKADNITDVYAITQQSQKLNEKLNKKKQKITSLIAQSVENAKRQVALDMKVNFHDSFGNLLILAKKTLKENKDEAKSKVLTDYYSNLSKIINEISTNERNGLSLNEIKSLACELEINLIIKGKIPTQDKYETIILFCINEVLKNTYRHAQADTINVEIKTLENKIILKLNNNDKSAPKHIKEKGGLLSLRQKIEDLGGDMNIYTKNGVCITVELKIGKGEKLNV